MVVSTSCTGSGVTTEGNIIHDILYIPQLALRNENFDNKKNPNLRRPNIFAELINYMKYFYDNVNLDKSEQHSNSIRIDKLSTCHQINILGAEKVLAQLPFKKIQKCKKIIGADR